MFYAIHFSCNLKAKLILIKFLSQSMLFRRKYYTDKPTLILFSEPDPRKNWKGVPGDRLGWMCTSPECRRASDWFMIACLRVFIGNKNRNPLVQLKETKNKWDLLAREVVGAQISSYWAHGWLETKWVRTNNYEFHTFRSVHFHLSLSPRPSF